MKKVFFVTSSIEVNNDYPLTYSAVRSHFSSEERFRQTCFTISSLDSIRDPNLDIFVIDLSENWEQYAGILEYQKNLKFISVKKEFPEIFLEARTHKNKSHCETLILSTFIQSRIKELEQYDYFFKLSGRYFIDGSFGTDWFTNDNTSKMFFKHPMKFDWIDSWPYQMVDRRSIQGDNKLYQYSSVLYGWGKDHFASILDINRVVCEITGSNKGQYYDIETLLYYFTRDFEKDIINVSWLVNGWDGVNGRYLKY